MIGLEILSGGAERTSVSARFKTTSANFQPGRTVLSMLSNSQRAAAIALADLQTVTEFAQQLYPSLRSSGLALYQLPKLVCFRPAIETTATFKQSKVILQSLPWSPNADNSQYSPFWLNGEQYKRIDTDSWTQIESGKARL
ncbi:hypothetical protein FALCPG4_010136 [Fusarium falciforme]